MRRKAKPKEWGGNSDVAEDLIPPTFTGDKTRIAPIFLQPAFPCAFLSRWFPREELPKHECYICKNDLCLFFQHMAGKEERQRPLSAYPNPDWIKMQTNIK